MSLPEIKTETRMVIYLVYSIIFFVYLLTQLNFFNSIFLLFGFTFFGIFGATVCYLVLKQKNLITLNGIKEMEEK